MDNWVFTGDEQRRYDRFVFESSMNTIGMGMPLLLWEQGVFAEVFNAVDNPGMPSSVPQVAVPGAPLIERNNGMIDPGMEIDPDPLAATKDVPRYSKHVRALNDKTYDEQKKLEWTRALACWLSLLKGSNFESSVGEHVKLCLEEGSRDGAIGVRSHSTVLKRGRDLKLFVAWVEKQAINWWPLRERTPLLYLDACEFEGKSKLIGNDLVHTNKHQCVPW